MGAVTGRVVATAAGAVAAEMAVGPGEVPAVGARRWSWWWGRKRWRTRRRRGRRWLWRWQRWGWRRWR